MKNKSLSFRTIVIRTIALVLGVWLILMVLMTLSLAEYFRQQMILQTQIYQDYADYYEEYKEHYPGEIEYGILWRRSGWSFSANYFRLGKIKEPNKFYYSSDNPFSEIQNGIRDSLDLPDFNEIAIINYDYNNQILMTSGNRLTFGYISEESWLDQSMKSVRSLGSCWIDLDAIPGAAQSIIDYHDGDTSVWHLGAARMTGWFEDDQFHPVTMEFAYHDPDNCLYQSSGLTMEDIKALLAYDEELWEQSHRSLSYDFPYLMDARLLSLLNDIQWNCVISLPVPEDRELVTIYANSFNGIINNPHLSVTVDGKTYDSLNDLRLESGHTDGVIGNLWETIIFRTVTKLCFRSDDTYTYALTVRCRPLQFAMIELIPIYAQTALVLTIAVALILLRIHQSLVWPMQRINRALADNTPIQVFEAWKEPYILEKKFTALRKNTVQAQAENTRLNTALDFAADAEARRKSMISTMARELKAPLASIRDYSQALRAHTAPENQSQNLQAVLDETDRMDSMVMQMLQLSRLEAGKVKLNMDFFSLASVIHAAVETIRPTLDEKGLELRLELSGNVEMKGDPIQLEKVVTQYIQNAVTYTGQGGIIQIKAFAGLHGTFFRVTNTHPHLSEDALSRVYDPFYREDSSQAKKHAGLGLAVTKGIISLHGFSECYACNTQLDNRDAVEFGFRPAS